MSIGREGPLIEFGGTIGAACGRRMRVPLDGIRVLVAAGTAAGFAAAYNTPFSAVLLVLETIVGVAAPVAMLPVIAATIMATVVTRTIVGAGPIYGQRAFALGSFVDLVWCGALGLLAAIVALAFKRALALIEDRFERHPLTQPLRATLGGALVGAIAIGLPEVAGNGYEPLNTMLDQRMIVGAIALLAVAKVIATSLSVSSGVPGGIFTPMLLVGAAVGTLWGHVAAMASGAPLAAGSYALVGMAATTAASIHAPLPAAVLAFELSGDYPPAPESKRSALSSDRTRRIRPPPDWQATHRRSARWSQSARRGPSQSWKRQPVPCRTRVHRQSRQAPRSRQRLSRRLLYLGMC